MSLLPRELTPDEIVLNIAMPVATGEDQTTDGKSWAIVGQDRSIRAMEMGIAIRAKGYNIFVVGESGTGKHTAILDILSRHRSKNNMLRDIAYVQDFQEPDKPDHLIFPEGQSRKFKNDIEMLVDRLKDRITHDLDGEVYKAKRDTLIAETEDGENKILAEFEAQINAKGFRTVHTEDDKKEQAADIAPVMDGETVLFEDLQDMVASGTITEEVWTEIRERYFVYMDTMKRIYREIRISRELLAGTLDELKNDTIRPGVHEECTVVAEKWPDDSIRSFLASMEKDVVENTDWFAGEEDEDVDPSIRYGVNVLLDRHSTSELPVIHETNPTKLNLFGTIEARYDASGEPRTSMMMIKAGSLLQADGGFLILHAEDVFSKDGLWPELKRALQTGHVVPEVQSTPLGPLPILMKPKPIITETTVILVGPVRFYEALCAGDDEFLKLFKVTAEFSSVMVREPRTEKEYATFARGLVSKEKLRPISPDGIRQIIAYGIQIAERRDRLSTRFSLIGDLIRESDYTAGLEGAKIIDGEIVKKAIVARHYIGDLPEKMLIDQIKEGTLLIDVDGKKIGAVNGLAVLEHGSHSFGTPLRITAAVGPGKDGLINIERESGLSGELHDKGIFLLEGYLRHRYARRRNISLTGSIAVEQSYYEIDGDSAAIAELAVLLSAIAEIPLRQDVAVTGAVNQQGVIQPVGGIHEKILGFFYACEAKGLNGQQGVIVPAGNIHNVILPDKLVDEMTAGNFHVWTANTIDEVMALLTGLSAGKKLKNDRFESDSINERVRLGLVELAKLS